MHLGNGAITPECVAVTLSAASAGLGLCAWSATREALRTRSASEGRTALLPSLALRSSMAAALGTLVFAAQAVNVPIPPGISAHLVGGVLLAWALGPAMGAMTMALVLLLQAALLSDGGMLALGANVINMALIPAGLVEFARRFGWLDSKSKGLSRDVAAVSLLGSASVILAAVLIVVDVALFKSGSELAGWIAFVQPMLSVHLMIGVAEGATIGVIVAALLGLTWPAKVPQFRTALVAAALAILTALAIPFSSELPDGYEYAAEQSGLLK